MGAFRPTSGSPKDGHNAAGTSYPSPNISVGPPIHPPPHLLPYLYPSGLYPPHHLSLLHNPAAAAAMNPGLLFNAQLALAAQHPALFGHYSAHAATSPLHGLKGHRFSPYSLPGSFGSAFDAVTPGGGNSSGPRSLSSSPRPRATSNSPPRPISVSPTPIVTSRANNNTTPPQVLAGSKSSPSELKSIEQMVNGLEMQQQNGGGSSGDEKNSDQWQQAMGTTIDDGDDLMDHQSDDQSIILDLDDSNAWPKIFINPSQYLN